MAKVTTAGALNGRLRGKVCVFDSGLIVVASGGSLVQITSRPFPPPPCNGGPFRPRINDRMAPLPLLAVGINYETALMRWWFGFRLMVNTCKGKPSLLTLLPQHRAVKKVVQKMDRNTEIP